MFKSASALALFMALLLLVTSLPGIHDTRAQTPKSKPTTATTAIKGEKTDAISTDKADKKPETNSDFSILSDEDIISLDTTDQKYPISKNTFVLLDETSQFTLQDIASKYRKDGLVSKNNYNKIMLRFKTHPFWIVFHATNNTDNENWYLDMGKLSDGRSGVLEKFLLYEVNQAKIFYNGLQSGATNTNGLINDRYFPITIPPHKDSIFLLYFVPTNYKRVAFSPEITANMTVEAATTPNQVQDYIPFVIMASILIILIGVSLTSSLNLVPFLIYYAGLFGWYVFVENPFFNSILGIGTISTLMPLSITLLVGIGCLLTITKQEHSGITRLLLILCLSLCGIAIMAFSFVMPEATDLKFYASGLLSMITAISAILFLTSNNNIYLKSTSMALAVWMLLYLVGNAVSFGASLLYIPYNFYTVQANYLALFPQILALLYGVISAVKSAHNQSLNSFIRQTQKAQSLLKAQQSKDDTDNTKLLRVIEREREVMEELRTREAERTEEMRQSKISADEANQAKSAFLAVVSHEIRTPMTGVMGMLRLLHDTNLTDEQRTYVTTIKDSGDAMVALLNDILDFSKIEDGKMTLEEIEFDPRRVLNGIAMLMKGHADQKHIQLRLNIDENVPSVLYGDPTRLRQVILNLVGNALKFTSKGHVTINAYRDPIYAAENNHTHCAIYFSIEDTGIGISQEAEANLFAPFAQADNSISRKYGGTGLGLAICRRLVEAMHGEIKLKSREGHGTTFFFTIPFKTGITQNGGHQGHDIGHNTPTVEPKVIAAPATKTATTTPVSAIQDYSAPSDQRLRFLIIDDNEINRKVVKAFLDKAHHESVIIYSGKEALGLLSTDNKFDVILLDIEMPDMNGKDVAKKMLNNKLLSHIPIIALTGNVSKDDLASYEKIGFSGCVSKPITPEKLLQTVESLLYGNGKDNGFLILDDDRGTIKHTPPPVTEQAKEQAPQDEDDGQAKQPSTSGKTIDEAMIKGLRDGLGKQQTIDLLKDLFIKADDILDNLKKSIPDNDKNAARISAHELRGMSANFGLKAVTLKSREIETISRDDERDLKEIEPHLDDLANLIERSKIALSDFLKD